jgi:hypothetical protein
MLKALHLGRNVFYTKNGKFIPKTRKPSVSALMNINSLTQNDL